MLPAEPLCQHLGLSPTDATVGVVALTPITAICCSTLAWEGLCHHSRVCQGPCMCTCLWPGPCHVLRCKVHVQWSRCSNTRTCQQPGTSLRTSESKASSLLCLPWPHHNVGTWTQVLPRLLLRTSQRRVGTLQTPAITNVCPGPQSLDLEEPLRQTVLKATVECLSGHQRTSSCWLCGPQLSKPKRHHATANLDCHPPAHTTHHTFIVLPFPRESVPYQSQSVNSERPDSFFKPSNTYARIKGWELGKCESSSNIQ